MLSSLSPLYSDWEPRPLANHPYLRSSPWLTQSRSFLDVPEAVSYVVLEPISLTLLTPGAQPASEFCLAKDGLELLVLPDSISHELEFQA